MEGSNRMTQGIVLYDYVCAVFVMSIFSLLWVACGRIGWFMLRELWEVYHFDFPHPINRHEFGGMENFLGPLFFIALIVIYIVNRITQFTDWGIKMQNKLITLSIERKKMRAALAKLNAKWDPDSNYDRR